MKFKVGDRVTVVAEVSGNRGNHHTQTGTIEHITPEPYPIKVKFEFDQYVFNEHEVEFEYIYHSPLYQALK